MPSITCGIDWAKAQHDIAVIDHSGRQLAKQRVTADAARFTVLAELLVEHGDGEPVAVAIETDKNLFVVALMAAGHDVYAINRGPARATGSAMARPAASPTRATRTCSPTSCAPTGQCTARCPRSASRHSPLERWPDNTKRLSGPTNRP